MTSFDFGRPFKWKNLKEVGSLADFKINKQKTTMKLKDQIKLMNKMDFKIEKKVKFLDINMTNMTSTLFQTIMWRHRIKVCQNGIKYNCHWDNFFDWDECFTQYVIIVPDNTCFDNWSTIQTMSEWYI